MRTLSLLRHAKSSWDNPALDDHERPLTKRGTKAAVDMAKFMTREGLAPDRVLCSTAVRTRATLALMIARLRQPHPDVLYDDALYLATPQVLLDHIRETPASIESLLIVGHNPGLHALALSLIGSGDHKAIATLAKGFPTAALATFTIKADSWATVKPASGHLSHTIWPRRLEA